MFMQINIFQRLQNTDYGILESDPNEENWNEKFQLCLSKPNTLEQIRLKNLAIHELCDSFMKTAEELVKILISEKFLPIEKKTLKPIGGKGIAGGEKYCSKNIFLKYAVDNHEIYGGDEFAMKAAAHELKGLKAYINCDIQNLHFPLLALIDYKGWRVIASSILPIDNTTLIYGSEDGGRTFHDDSNEMREKMIQAAKIINIKGHFLEVLDSNPITLYSCFDIEGHQGKDGRFYILDTARVFPCETPNSKNRIHGVHLYNLLRPEHVKTEKVPLSSDANVPIGEPFNTSENYNLEVILSTKRLIENVIPNVASKINSHQITLFDNETLVVVLHKFGINLRFLGLLRSFTTLSHVRTLMLSEMVSRVLKNAIRKEMRNLTDKTNSEEEFNELVIKFFNRIFGSSSKAKDYWKDIRKMLIGKFDYWQINEYLSAAVRSRSSLDPTELEESYDLSKNINNFVLFQSLQQILGIKFKTEVNQNMFYDSTLFENPAPFNVSQIQAIVSIRKSFITEDETVPLLWSYHLKEQQKIQQSILDPNQSSILISFLHKYIQSLDNLVLDIEKYFGNESAYLPKVLIEKTVSFIELDLIEFGRKEAEKAEKLCETQIGSNLRWYINYVNILKLISKMAYLQNKPGIALEYCKRTIELIEKIYTNHPLCATIYYEIGIMNHIPFEIQLENLYKAKDILSITYGQNSSDYALVIKAIASVYFNQTKYEDSNKYFGLAYEILKESKSIDSIEILLYLAEINLENRLEIVFDYLNQFFAEILTFQRNEIPWNLLIQFFKILSRIHYQKNQPELVINYLSLASLISVGLPIKHNHNSLHDIEAFIEILKKESKLQNIISLKDQQISLSDDFSQLPPDRQFIILLILKNSEHIEKDRLKDVEKILNQVFQICLSKFQIPDGTLELSLEIINYLREIRYLQRLANFLSEKGDCTLKLNLYLCCFSLIQHCFKYGSSSIKESSQSLQMKLEELNNLNLVELLDEINSRTLIKQLLESILILFGESINTSFKLIPDKKDVIGFINSIENLTEFGKVLGMTNLEFDQNNTCILGIDNDFSLHLTYEPYTKKLYLYSPLLDGLPKTMEDRLALYERLLEGAMLGGQMVGGGVGVAVKEELILIHCTIEMKDVLPSALRNFAHVYVECVEKWRGICHLLRNKPKNSCYVHVLEGKDFKNDTTYIVASAKPYTSYTTKVQKNTFNPQWKEKFKIHFDSFDLKINIKVMIGDTNALASKNLLGTYEVQVLDLFKQGNEIILPTWVDLTLNGEPTGAKLLIRISDLEGDFRFTFGLSEKVVIYEDDSIDYSLQGSSSNSLLRFFETQPNMRNINENSSLNHSSSNWHDRLEELRKKEILEQQLTVSEFDVAKQNLSEFGNLLNLSNLTFDENNTCILGIDNTFSMHMTYESNSSRIYIYSPLLDGLPRNPEVRFTLYETLLEGSLLGGKMAGGGVGVAIAEQLILMHCIVQITLKSPSHLLKNFAPLYIETVEKWRKICNDIVTGVTPPNQIIITPEKHSTNNFSNYSCGNCSRNKFEDELFYCSHCGEIRCNKCTGIEHPKDHVFLVFERPLPQELSSKPALLSSSFYPDDFKETPSNNNLGQCNYCQFHIWNNIYRCSICPNFNLCENCFQTKRHGTSHVFFYSAFKMDEKKSLNIKLNSFYPEDFLQPQQRFLNEDKSGLIAIDDFLKSHKNWYAFMCEAELELVLFLYENSPSQESYSASVYALLSYFLTPKKYLNEPAFNFRNKYASILKNRIDIEEFLSKLLSQSKQNPYLGIAVGRAILDCFHLKWDYGLRLFLQLLSLAIQFYIDSTIEFSTVACLIALCEFSNSLFSFPQICQEAVLNKLIGTFKTPNTSEILYCSSRLLVNITSKSSVELVEKLVELDVPNLFLKHGLEAKATDKVHPFFFSYSVDIFQILSNILCKEKIIFLKLPELLAPDYQEKIILLLVNPSIPSFIQTAALRFLVNIGDPKLILWFLDQHKDSELAMINLIDVITRVIVFTKNEKFAANLRANGFIKQMMNLILVTKHQYLLDSICLCFQSFINHDENVSKILESNISELNKLSESKEKSLSFCGIFLLVLISYKFDYLMEYKFPKLLDYLENEKEKSVHLQTIIFRIITYSSLISAEQSKKLFQSGILKRFIDIFFKINSIENRGYYLGCILFHCANELGNQLYPFIMEQLSEEVLLRTENFYTNNWTWCLFIICHHNSTLAKEVSSKPHIIQLVQKSLHDTIQCLPVYVCLAIVLLNANPDLSNTLTPLIEKQFDKVFKQFSSMDSFENFISIIQSLVCYLEFSPSIYIPRMKQFNILQIIHSRMEQIFSSQNMSLALNLLYLLITKDASLKEEYLKDKGFVNYIEKLAKNGSIHIQPSVQKLNDLKEDKMN